MPLLHSLAESLAERALRGRLAALRHGALDLVDGSRRTRFGDPSTDAPELVVRDRRFYPSLAFRGSVGGGEAYAAGYWESDDLAGIVRLFARNEQALAGLEGGWALLAQPARRLLHVLRRNTRAGSRRNIGAHYDLGNDFFAAFLDETLTYSCGLFEQPGASLAQASTAKYERLCRLLELQRGEHVLEIGTGWGGFALHAAAHHGCRVTTTTISRQQALLAARRFADAGLADRITLLTRDYRDLTGEYDKLVSIEMVEAVGHEYLRDFFALCAARLAPHGRMALQAITIEDRRYESARREVDFIKRHIFPGCTIPSLASLATAARDTDLRLLAAQDLGSHYAETLRRWRENLREQWTALRGRGYDERLLRLWEFYFAYCEGGFDAGALGLLQLAYARPAAVVAAADARRAGRRPAHAAQAAQAAHAPTGDPARGEAAA